MMILQPQPRPGDARDDRVLQRLGLLHWPRHGCSGDQGGQGGQGGHGGQGGQGSQGGQDGHGGQGGQGNQDGQDSQDGQGGKGGQAMFAQMVKRLKIVVKAVDISYKTKDETGHSRIVHKTLLQDYLFLYLSITNHNKGK